MALNMHLLSPTVHCFSSQWSDAIVSAVVEGCDVTCGTATPGWYGWCGAFRGLFLAILFLAVVGFGIARLLYIGGRWCAERIRRLHTMNGTSTMHAVVRMVPHHH